MKHFDLHECPECQSDGLVRGYRCDVCDGRGFLDEEEWRDWCDFRADEQQRYEAERRAK